MPDNSTTPHATAGRALIGLGALVATLAALAWLLFLRGGDTSGHPVAAGGAPEAPRVEDASPRAPGSRTELVQAASGSATGAWSDTGIAVAPGVRLPGRGKLEGRVVERGTGAPVAGARVDLVTIAPAAVEFLGPMLRMGRAPEGMSDRTLPVAVTTSGADGSFAFEGVRQGRYFLDVRGRYHVPDGVPLVRVSPSGDGGPVDAYVRSGGRVLGRVLRPDGEPAARALVNLFPGPGAFIPAFRNGSLRRLETKCDREGRFVIEGVTPGRGYELHSVGPGYGVAHALVPEVRAGQDVHVEFETRVAGTVQGRVVSALDGDAAERTPLAGAWVGVLPRGLRDMAFTEEVLALTSVETGEDGRFVLRDVPPGAVDLVAIAQDHLSAEPRIVRISGGARLDVGDVVLGQGPTVRGRVVDGSGAPLQGVHVRWFTGSVHRPETFNISLAPLMAQAVGDFRFPTTDAEGRFAAGPLPGRAPHHLYFGLEGYAYHRHAWDPEADGDEIEVVLTAGGAVEGRVIDAETEEPIPSFTISGTDRIDQSFASPTSWNPYAGGELVDDPEGRFRIEGVLPGKSELSFAAPGYQTASVRNLRVVEGETLADVVVELHAGGQVRGRVLDVEGRPVAGAEVGPVGGSGWSLARAMQRANSHRTAGEYADTEEESVTNGMVNAATRMGIIADGAVLTDEEGRYELDGLEPGPWTVVARHRDYALGTSEPIELGAGDSVDGVDVELTRGASVHGTISDRYGRPLPDAFVLLISPSEFSGDDAAEAAVYEGSADAQGHYEIEHMAGGNYFVTVMRGDDELDPMTLLGSLRLDMVFVPPEQRVRYDVRDRSAAGCRVFGEVSTGEAPVTTGGVLALKDDESSALGLELKIAQVHEDATYEFAGLEPGAYVFVYQSPGNELRLDVEVPDEPDHRIDLALPWGGVRGRVVDADTGEPIEGAPVRLVSSDSALPDAPLVRFLAREAGSSTRHSGEDGAFEFLGHQAGTYLLFADAPTHGPHSGRYAPSAPIEVAIDTDRTTEGVVVELAGGATLRGSATGIDGAPLSRVTVTLVPHDERTSAPRPVRSDREGRFEIGPLVAGSYDVQATRSGFADAWIEGLEVGESDPDELALVLHEGVPLTVSVRDASGTPLGGAACVVYSASGGARTTPNPEQGIFSWFLGRGVTGLDGQLDLGRFEPGPYRLEVRHASFETWSREVELFAGAPLDVDAELLTRRED